MSQPREPSRPVSQPALAELFAHYLGQQVTAQQAGLGFVDTAGEVTPFEAVPVQPLDPRLAWDEALTAVHYLNPSFQAQSMPAPPEWAPLAAGREPVLALAFCMGNYPQLVRNLHQLLHATDLTALRTSASAPAPAPSLVEWAGQATRQRQFPQALLAVGILRLAGQLDSAADQLRKLSGQLPDEWQATWANEEAALAWQRGQDAEAVRLWNSQAETVPVLFNRGMAALFQGRTADARSYLGRAAGQLPEQSGWHHLARLYLALAEARG